MTNAARDEMRVAIVGPDLDKTPGGMATISRAILESSELAAAGVQVRFIASHAEGGAFVKLRMALGAMSEMWRLRSELDLIHLQTATRASVERKAVLALWCRAVRLPFVVHLHGAGVADDYRGGTRTHRVVFRLLIRLSECVFVLGEPFREWLQSEGLNVPVAVVPNFVDLSIMEPAHQGGFVAEVVTVGRLGERKGTWDLLQALSAIGRSTLAPKTLLIGDGEVDEARRRICADPQLAGRVEAVGLLPHEAAIAAIRNSSVFVLPSYAEGLPMAVLEAMASGRTVITTHVGALPDAIEDRVTGLVVAPGDIAGLATAISKAVSDQSLRAHLGVNGRLKVEAEYSEQSVARKLCEAWRRAAGLKATEKEAVWVDGVPIARTTMSEVCSRVVKAYHCGRGGRIATANIDQLAQLRRNPQLRRFFLAADYTLADGQPLVWAARLGRNPLPERVTGADLLFRLAGESATSGAALFLLGGSPGVADAAATALSSRYPGAREIGTYCPPWGFENDATELARVVAALETFGPAIVFCGLGFPKQEGLIEFLAPRFPASWFISCGAALGFAAGEHSRAPNWLQRRGAEWLFRMWQEPRRLGPRYIKRDAPYALGLLARSIFGQAVSVGPEDAPV